MAYLAAWDVHRHRTARLAHLPLHASWLNQVEIFFSVLQRKVSPRPTPSTRPNGPSGCAFQDHYERIAHPFEWRFTRSDHDRMLAAASSPLRDAGAARRLFGLVRMMGPTVGQRT